MGRALLAVDRHSIDCGTRDRGFFLPALRGTDDLLDPGVRSDRDAPSALLDVARESNRGIVDAGGTGDLSGDARFTRRRGSPPSGARARLASDLVQPSASQDGARTYTGRARQATRRAPGDRPLPSAIAIEI